MRLNNKIFNLNDPGWGRDSGKNGSEPPRRPEKQDGPPDLDEVWRDFNSRLGSLFGKKGRRSPPGGMPPGSGNGPSIPKGSPKLLIIGGVVAVGLWMASGFTIVQEGQVAVVTRFGEYTKTLNPGLQWRWPAPIEDHQTVNISQLRTFEVGYRGSARNKVLPESLMLTTDENIVDMQYVVQYRLLPTGAPDYLFNTNNPDESVRQAAETAMREVVGKQPMDSVLYSGRTQIASDVQQLAQSILDRYRTGIQISTVAIQNVQPPEQVQAAFDDAVKAGQDRERQINEGQAYANKVLPEAAGQVARMMQESEGYKARVIGDAKGDTARFGSVEAEYVKAPGVTRDRLYLSTIQEILESTSKVLVDTRSDNNMIYLPLDKIVRQVGSRTDMEPSAPVASAASQGQISRPAPAAAPKAPAPGNPAGLDTSLGSLVSPYSPYAR
ncbi:FtsH protease activity modulator HflK [Alcaligenes faecalis]|jgi:membrane protease subunit HflK|uniref:Protein HflK n=1 Tax=Alcaligenes faecalis TaxID=511 RepID=A0ABY7MYA8_ALCFA|nr:FtsH protease activity modulator HflK [Alcaligenes faecalis]KAA1288798.1 FtsH protease activity modulator HflK [Alcaligenes faecalis]OSZ36505.1 HflK protein [Alcaligenes faecalis]OSZ46626.1 HflK protein [Alcaligenes faecalis]WBM36725.1 FtsH protease activity modulator HflK [Alcaligenes faecalis]